MLRSRGVRWGLVGLATAMLAAATTAQAADAAAGQANYQVCVACHGAQGEGNVALNAPRLAGQEPWYLRRQMNAFRDGLRGTKPGDTFGAQMRPMAMTIADEAALENLIAYIGTLSAAPAEPTVEGDVAAGEKAYTICIACHGKQAEGLEQMGGPRLAGQNDWYLLRQLLNYQQGLRGYDSKDIYGNQMKPMASTLTSEKAVQDVVAYINTLH